MSGPAEGSPFSSVARIGCSCLVFGSEIFSSTSGEAIPSPGGQVCGRVQGSKSLAAHMFP